MPTLLLAILMVSFAVLTARPALAATAHDAVVRAGFIYDTGAYPQVHASTLVETSGGELLAAWFGGTAESNPDVCIWLSRFEEGRWTPGLRVADGVQHAGKRYPTWNPVLFQPANGPLMLFYKVGPTPETWWGMLATSSDGGRTWSAPQRLPEDVLGPIKNKPVQLADGSIVAPSSTENAQTKAWLTHIEITRDLGRTWEIVGPIHTAAEFNAIQGSLLTYPDGRLQLLCRTKEKVLATSWSADGGRTWSRMASSGLFNPNSGSDAVTLRDGRQVLIYNLRERAGGAPRNPKSNALGGAFVSLEDANEDWGVRWPLNFSVSKDGVSWQMVITLEDEPRRHGYAYPAVIQTRDGLIHISYTWNREKIKHVIVDPSRL